MVNFFYLFRKEKKKRKQKGNLILYELAAVIRLELLKALQHFACQGHQEALQPYISPNSIKKFTLVLRVEAKAS